MVVAAARFRPTSANKKLSPVEKVPYEGHPLFSNTSSPFRFRPTPRAPYCCSTYVSIAATCSEECPFKRGEDGEPGGCFIDADHFTRRSMASLDEGARGKAAWDVILEEVRGIDAAWPRGVPQDGARGGRDLRLHVGGDVPDEDAAELLSHAAARWRRRRGGSVWTYTHTWRSIPRKAFGGISVLASVERPEQVRQAKARGYAPALVVEKFPNGKRPFTVAGTRFIPCPAESLGTKTCVTCRLCLDVDLHRMGAGIAFAVHGSDADAARAALVPLKTRRAAA